MHLNPQLSVKSTLKLVQSNPNEIRNNSLNTSSSKMQYSIPKSKRFSFQKNTTQKSKFYDLPELKSNRSTSFGYGDKIDLSKKTLVTPSPLNYTINRQFDNKDKKNGITFGSGRDMVKNINTFGIKSYKVPGPQQYTPNYHTLQDTPKYSISSKHDLDNKWKKIVPGPGAYSTMQLTKNNDKLSVSNFSNSPSMAFPKNKRLSDYEQKIRLLRVPGPGQYKTQQLTNIVEKYRREGGKSFGKSQRVGIMQKSITPGPGSYKCFSQFIY